MNNQIVVFALDSEHFGVNIASLESIIKMQAITKLPQAPPYVEGITNLRGKVLPVIDLHKRLRLAAQTTDKDSRIIVVSLTETKVGMIVDGVSEVLTVSEQAVEPPPSIAATIDSSLAASKMSSLANELAAAMDRVSSVVEENTASTEEMAAGTGEVTSAIENIASVSEENSASTEEVSASAEEMSAQVEEVIASAHTLAEMAEAHQQVVAQFNLGNHLNQFAEQQSNQPLSRKYIQAYHVELISGRNRQHALTPDKLVSKG